MDLLDALIHFLRFLCYLRNLSLEIARYRRVAGSGQGQLPANSKSGNRLPSTCSTQPYKNGLFNKPFPTLGRATCVPEAPVSNYRSLRVRYAQPSHAAAQKA
jgi:hypothetical protein